MTDGGDRPVVVAGGGIGGLTVALCLARQGFAVQVLEQAPEFTEVGAGIQLSPNCSRVLHHLGLEAGLRESAFLPEGVEIRHWRSGRVLSSNPLGAEAVRAYGFPYYHIHRADLLDLLVRAARSEPRIELHTAAAVVQIHAEADAVRVVAGGRSVEGLALVGADGIHSTVRRALFGEDAATFTGNVAWRALVPVESLPDGLVRPVAGVWWGPGRHFVHYYVRRGELVNCVCVVEQSGWTVESWTERGDHGQLQREFAGWHPTIRALIDNMNPQSCYRWALFDRPPMPRWSRGRITLLGDACHPTLPFQAQGAAMAVEDAAVLARCLACGRTVPESFSRYESLRRARTARVQAGSRRNARVFHLSGVAAWLRNRAVSRAGGRVMDGLYRYNALEVG